MNSHSKFPITRLGNDGQHYFFGYYNKTNWNQAGTRLLANQVRWRDHYLTPDLTANVGYFDLAGDNSYKVIGTTSTWNWQMGCQLQWVGLGKQSQAIFNVRTDDADAHYPYFCSRIVDVESGEERQLPLPIYVAASSGQYALSVDYRRLYVTHETIGYSCDRHRPDLRKCPADDGIFRMELETGAYRLLVSYADLAAFEPRDSMKKAIHWVSHIEVNPSSTRILFLHRWTERVEDETCFLHRLITMNPDGSDMRLLECSDHPLPQLAEGFDPTQVGTFDYEKSEWQISHPLWRNDHEIIVWGPHAGEIHYHLYEDRQGGEVTVIGRGVLTENGHMTFSPTDQRWLLSDTYPDSTTHERVLFLFDVQTARRHDLGTFYADPHLSKANRCDLHPRWRADGQAVCIDSVHEDDRNMYVIDVSSLTGR